MNCATARQSLLSSEQPNRVGTDLTNHLSACPACRTLQRRLVRIERGIPHLPVPPSRPPAQLLEQVLHGEPLVRPTVLARNPDRIRESGRQKLALAFALAASLAVFAIGLWLRVEKKLPPTRDPRQCVEQLTDLADELFDEARVANPERLGVLARYFDWLMRQDLPYHAGQLSSAERVVVLPRITSKLNELENAVSSLSQQRTEVRSSLRQIAAAVRVANQRLQQLAEQRS
jgi:hypothetical protein